ncbi:MAG: response regulator [Anaerolineae bacterium]
MKRLKILVVEDEQTTRRMLSFNLKHQGYDVVEAEDGDQAYQTAVEEQPDLVLLDIMMPGDNGFEVCKKIRATESMRNTPIIMLTARAGPADKNYAFMAGADDYLTKPVDLTLLNERVAAAIKEAAIAVPVERPPEPGQVISLFSPQHQMGVTTLATKLAATLARQKKHPVVLMDLVLPYGDIARYLALDSTLHSAQLLSQPTIQITLEYIQSAMQEHPDGFSVITGPVRGTHSDQFRPTPDNLTHALSLLVEASYYVVLDLGATLTELNLAAIRQSSKIFAVTSGQPSANEAVDNFLILARKLGLDLGRLMPVVNQLQGPVGNTIVLVRSPIARIPYIPQNDIQDSLWSSELALQKLNTIVTGS